MIAIYIRVRIKLTPSVRDRNKELIIHRIIYIRSNSILYTNGAIVYASDLYSMKSIVERLKYDITTRVNVTV